MNSTFKTFIAVSWVGLSILSTFMLGEAWWISFLVAVNNLLLLYKIEDLEDWVMKNEPTVRSKPN